MKWNVPLLSCPPSCKLGALQIAREGPIELPSPTIGYLSRRYLPLLTKHMLLACQRLKKRFHIELAESAKQSADSIGVSSRVLWCLLRMLRAKAAAKRFFIQCFVQPINSSISINLMNCALGCVIVASRANFRATFSLFNSAVLARRH